MPSHFHGYYGLALANIQLVIPASELMHMLLSLEVRESVYIPTRSLFFPLFNLCPIVRNNIVILIFVMSSCV